MRIERYNPKSIEEIHHLVERAASGATTVVAQAGHFVLYWDDETQTVRPCIATPGMPKCGSIVEKNGHFPLLTWKLGLSLLGMTPGETKEALVLVNDWQYLPKDANRKEFYEQNPDLPPSYISHVAIRDGLIHMFRPQLDSSEPVTGAFFGEMNLRNRYKKRIARMIRNKTLPADAILTPVGEHLSCSLTLNGGQLSEIYCTGKSADCTAEVAELLMQVFAVRPRSVFINVYPLVCREFVEKGTLLAARLDYCNISCVVNIGVPSFRVFEEDDLLKQCEVVVLHFPDQ